VRVPDRGRNASQEGSHALRLRQHHMHQSAPALNANIPKSLLDSGNVCFTIPARLKHGGARVRVGRSFEINAHLSGQSGRVSGARVTSSLSQRSTCDE
jgi:hypothetical protein